MKSIVALLLLLSAALVLSSGKSASPAVTGGSASLGAKALSLRATPTSASSPAANAAQTHTFPTLPSRPSFFGGIKDNIVHFETSLRRMGRELHTSFHAHRKRHAQGVAALSFDEFEAIQRSHEDAFKLVRLAATWPLYKNWFWLSNFVFPLGAVPRTAMTWSHLPAAFTSPAHQAMLAENQRQGRLLTLLQAVTQLHQEVLAAPLRARPAARNKDSPSVRAWESIQAALSLCGESAESVERALRSLEPWYTSPAQRERRLSLPFLSASSHNAPAQPTQAQLNQNSSNTQVASITLQLAHSKSTSRLQLGRLSPAVVRDIVRGLGGTPAPHWPLVRALDRVTANSLIRRLRDSDVFLSMLGVQRLTPPQLRTACTQRGIGLHGKTDEALRRDLSQWLSLVDQPTTTLGVRVNELNKRLALMSLHVVKDARSDPAMRTYQALFSSASSAEPQEKDNKKKK